MDEEDRCDWKVGEFSCLNLYKIPREREDRVETRRSFRTVEIRVLQRV